MLELWVKWQQGRRRVCPRKRRDVQHHSNFVRNFGSILSWPRGLRPAQRRRRGVHREICVSYYIDMENYQQKQKPSFALTAHTLIFTSSQNTMGSLPPNSKITGRSTLDAPSITRRPTPGDPVKIILSTNGHWTNAAPASPNPVITCTKFGSCPFTLSVAWTICAK